jgi:hypothetical protein
MQQRHDNADADRQCQRNHRRSGQGQAEPRELDVQPRFTKIFIMLSGRKVMRNSPLLRKAQQEKHSGIGPRRSFDPTVLRPSSPQTRSR